MARLYLWLQRCTWRTGHRVRQYLANRHKSTSVSCEALTSQSPTASLPILTCFLRPPGVADGVRYVTAWPSTLTVACSWDRDLMGQYASAMAREQKMKGSNVMLGPMVNIARVPRGGTSTRLIMMLVFKRCSCPCRSVPPL